MEWDNIFCVCVCVKVESSRGNSFNINTKIVRDTTSTNISCTGQCCDFGIFCFHKTPPVGNRQYYYILSPKCYFSFGCLHWYLDRNIHFSSTKLPSSSIPVCILKIITEGYDHRSFREWVIEDFIPKNMTRWRWFFLAVDSNFWLMVW